MPHAACFESIGNYVMQVRLKLLLLRKKSHGNRNRCGPRSTHPCTCGMSSPTVVTASLAAKRRQFETCAGCAWNGSPRFGQPGVCHGTRCWCCAGQSAFLDTRRKWFSRQSLPVHKHCSKLVVEPLILCRAGRAGASWAPPATNPVCSAACRQQREPC